MSQEIDRGSCEGIVRIVDGLSNPDPGVLPAEVRLPMTDMVARVCKSSVAFFDTDDLDDPLFYVPVAHYRGIVISVEEALAGSGNLLFISELHSQNKSLSVPLSIALDVEEAQDHAARWARVLDLPLVVRSKDNELSEIDRELLAFTMRDALPEYKRPRAMIVASDRLDRRMPVLQYDGWDLVAWQ